MALWEPEFQENPPGVTLDSSEKEAKYIPTSPLGTSGEQLQVIRTRRKGDLGCANPILRVSCFGSFSDLGPSRDLLYLLSRKQSSRSFPFSILPKASLREA